MPKILNDSEIRKLLGTVIIDGDPACIRPNAYVLRLGGVGEFLNTGKDFELGTKKKGIRIQPGHAVGITAHETLDFRRETVHKIFPGEDLHGIVSPTTDLSREGVMAPTTQVDAGFHGTLNWTLTNNSSEERRFVIKERIYRITIFRLEKGETPEGLYTGDYQAQTGYVRSRRAGAPVGLKESEWEDAQSKGGPEDLLESLLRAGYPWNILGSRLKEIDQQFKSVTEEYAFIKDSIDKMAAQIDSMHAKQAGVPETVRSVLKEEATALENRWMIGVASIISAFGGLGLALYSKTDMLNFVLEHSGPIGVALVIASTVVLMVIARQKK